MHNFKGFLIAIIVFLLDQLSKFYIVKAFTANKASVIEVTSFFNMILTWNKGITFGLFNKLDHNRIVFSLLATIITITLIIWLKRTKVQLQIYALGLIIGGAVGNIIDRIRFGAVVDFLDFHLAGYHWHTFNVADAAICLGVALLLIDNFTNKINYEKQNG